MTNLQLLIAASAEVCLSLCLIGILRTGRWRLCLSFTAYVAAVLGFEIAYVWFPGRYFNWNFYLTKQAVFEGLRLLIALELAYRAFRWFPGAKKASSVLILAVLGVTGFALTTVDSRSDVRIFLLGVFSHLSLGTLWILGVTWVVVWRYAVLLHPFHRGLLSSFAPYIAMFSGLAHLFTLIHKDARFYLAVFDPLAYLALAAWFAWIAWNGADEGGYERVTESLKLRLA